MKNARIVNTLHFLSIFITVILIIGRDMEYTLLYFYQMTVKLMLVSTLKEMMNWMLTAKKYLSKLKLEDVTNSGALGNRIYWWLKFEDVKEQ